MNELTDTLLNGRFELSEAHIERNKRVLRKLSESATKKVTKKEAYRQYDLIKSSSNRR